MSWNNNTYDDPGKYGLAQVGELWEPDMSYEFNMLVVWKHADGRVFYAEDRGCSCPSPFENYEELSDLTEVTPATFTVFVRTVQEFALPYHWARDERDNVAQPLVKQYEPDKLAADKVVLISEVSKLVGWDSPISLDNDPED